MNIVLKRTKVINIRDLAQISYEVPAELSARVSFASQTPKSAGETRTRLGKKRELRIAQRKGRFARLEQLELFLPRKRL